MRNALPMSGACRNKSGKSGRNNASKSDIQLHMQRGTTACTLTILAIFDRPNNWYDISGMVLRQ